jgi:hypothetical protein
VYVPWSQLEATQGDYTAGIALLRAEIDHLKAYAPPKRLLLAVFDEPNYSICRDQQCQANFFPPYVQASCLAFSTSNYVTKLKHWQPTCRQYYINLINALGAAFDGEPFFEGILLTYESIVENPDQQDGYSNAACDDGFRAIMSAAAAAFPRSNVSFGGANWYCDGTDTPLMQSAAAYAASIGVGWGSGDTFPGYSQDGVPGDGIYTGHIGGVDYRGVIPDFQKYEDTELGYQTNGLSQRGYTGDELYDYTNNTMQSQYMLHERDRGVGFDNSRWYACGNNDSPDMTNFYDFCGGPAPGGLLNVVNNDPLTHTSCPTRYDELFGDGTAGSGCDSN